MPNICTGAIIDCSGYNMGMCRSEKTCCFKMPSNTPNLLDKYNAINWAYLAQVLENQEQIMKAQEQILNRLNNLEKQR